MVTSGRRRNFVRLSWMLFVPLWREILCCWTLWPLTLSLRLSNGASCRALWAKKKYRLVSPQWCRSEQLPFSDLVGEQRRQQATCAKNNTKRENKVAFNRWVLCLSQWKKNQVCMFTVVAFLGGKQKKKKKGENTMTCGPIFLWRIRLLSKKLEAKMFFRSCRWSCCWNPCFTNLFSSFWSFKVLFSLFQDQTAATFCEYSKLEFLPPKPAVPNYTGFLFQPNTISEVCSLKKCKKQNSGGICCWKN